MTKRAWTLLMLFIVAALVVTGASQTSSSAAPAPPPSPKAAVRSQTRKLRTRPRRRGPLRRSAGRASTTGPRVDVLDDETVNEGQGYGKLVAVAVAVGDKRKFESIWSWTKKNLERPDGLLAWQWKTGKVVDSQPAGDADLDIARAFVLAGSKFAQPLWTKVGPSLGETILSSMTAPTSDGRILLPGTWAAGQAPCYHIPSNASPATFEELAKVTSDPRWQQLAVGFRTVTMRILNATALPSGWAQVNADGSVVPLAGPTGTGGTVEYGYSAGRLALRYAGSCNPADVALAAKLVARVSGKNPLLMQLDLGGTEVGTDPSPLGYVARAAAEASSGNDRGAATDLKAADVLAQGTPTYYGLAWDALGAFQLHASALGACSPLKGR